MRIIKTALIILLISVIALSSYLYLNRLSIFDKTINRLMKNLMPAYIEAGNIDFNFESKKISVTEFKILNPPRYTHPYLIEIPAIECFYRQVDDASILKGMKINKIELIKPVIYIERLRDSSINVTEMEEVFKKSAVIQKPGFSSKILGVLSYLLSPVKRIDKLIEIEPVFNIREGKLLFDDGYLTSAGYKTTIENIDSKITLDLKEGFKGADYLKTEGRGLLNGKENQLLDWVSEYDPARAKLTMLNTLHIKDVDFIHFRPYYDRFSPFIFSRGMASGDLIFNFDDGNIGSTNELRLSNLILQPKEDFPYKDFWIANIEDLYKYFASASGEVVFDFKIKGPMGNPKFYPGSKTKRALAGMVVNKIADTIFTEDAGPSEPRTPGAPEKEKSDIERVIDIFRNF